MGRRQVEGRVFFVLGGYEKGGEWTNWSKNELPSFFLGYKNMVYYPDECRKTATHISGNHVLRGVGIRNGGS